MMTRLRPTRGQVFAAALLSLATCSWYGAAAGEDEGSGMQGGHRLETARQSEDGVYGFALELSSKLLSAHPDENVAFSPYSISAALGMLSLGARGQTKTEMERALGIEGIPEESLGSRWALSLSTPLRRDRLLGLWVDPFDPDYGVVVTQVRPGSPAEKKGIRPRDLIFTVNGKIASDPRQFADAVASSGGKVRLQGFHRDAKSVFDYALTLPPSAAGGSPLTMANGVWIGKEQRILPAFATAVASQFNAATQALDFEHDQIGALRAINSWVAGRTGGRIASLFPEQPLASVPKCVVASATYFRARWNTPFDAELTKPGPFHAAAEEVITPMMSQTDVFAYFETENVKAVELPYAGTTASMVLLLPRAACDLGRLESDALGSGKLRDWLRGLRPEMVELTMPRFEIRFRCDLPELLRSMGVVTPFSDEADFGRLAASLELKLDVVRHEAFLKVDESGTEAAGATGATIVPRSEWPDPPKQFKADRPFLVLIRDARTGTPLFVGHVARPEAATQQDDHTTAKRERRVVKLRIGVVVADNKGEGVVVVAVDPRSAATRGIDVDSKGVLELEKGDVILAVDGLGVRNLSDCTAAVGKARRFVRLRVRSVRDGRLRTVHLRLD